MGFILFLHYGISIYMLNRKKVQIESLQSQLDSLSSENTALQSEHNKYREVQIKLARHTFEKIHDLSIAGYQSIPPVDGESSEYNLSRIFTQTLRHKPGNLQAVRFHDAALFQFTTQRALSDRLHTFTVANEPDRVRYTYRSINEDCQVIGSSSPIAATSVDEMIANPEFILDLGTFKSLVEVAASARWVNRIGAEALQRAHIPTIEQAPTKPQE